MTDPAKEVSARRRMHQTTLRFAPDLWMALSAEAERAGVSVAQYVREAALARIAYTAGTRGDAEYEAALRAIGGHPATGELESRRSRGAIERSEQQIEGSAALWAQSRLARERAHELRAKNARRTKEK
jgi:hypothetical protein